MAAHRAERAQPGSTVLPVGTERLCEGPETAQAGGRADTARRSTPHPRPSPQSPGAEARPPPTLGLSTHTDDRPSSWPPKGPVPTLPLGGLHVFVFFSLPLPSDPSKSSPTLTHCCPGLCSLLAPHRASARSLPSVLSLPPQPGCVPLCPPWPRVLWAMASGNRVFADVIKLRLR